VLIRITTVLQGNKQVIYVQQHIDYIIIVSAITEWLAANLPSI
jgi:hypothetical protein